MQFTGERWIPGQVDHRIEDDHVQRYVFASRFTRGKCVLDIACGVGAGAHLLISKGEAAHVDGVDLSDEAIAFARSHYDHPCLSFQVGNIETYAPNEPVDLITCFETIEHVPDDILVLRNLKLWIKPGGILLISSPNRPITSPGTSSIEDKPANSFHVREFTPSELKNRLRKVGFSAVQTFGQRLRWHSHHGSVVNILDMARKICRLQPDRDSTPKVRPYLLRTPRYFVLMARA